MHNPFTQSIEPVSAEPRDKGLGAFTRYGLLVPLCVIGIVIANAYSLMITNNGLLMSNIFPDLHVLEYAVPQTRATFVFALVLQFGIMVLYLVLAAGRPLHKLVVLPFLASLVAVSFYFGFLSVHANSRGDAYVASLTKRIDNLSSAVTGENRFIAASVQQALQGQLDLAQASRRGHDKTGVAACGPLCQGHYDQAETIRTRYSHLLTVPEAPPAGDDIRQQWRDAAAQFAAYSNRARDFEQFLAEQGGSQSYAVDPALAEVHAMLQQIFGKGQDDRWMLTAHSLRDIFKDVSVAVSALISIIPDIINLSLSFAIGALLQLSRRRKARPVVGRVRDEPMRPNRIEPKMSNLPPPVEDAVRLPSLNVIPDFTPNRNRA
jgi:hypothetical protein